jgi:hypothetical protein
MRAMMIFPDYIRRVIAVIAAMLLTFSPAIAQVVYKHVDKDGKTVYSDRVIPGMKVIGELAPPAAPDPGLAAAARAAQAERAQQAEDYAKERARALDVADNKIRQAEHRLAAAKRALEAGKDPLPGERLGTVRKSFTSLSEAYWQRISALEDEVSAATKQVEQAYSERNALRD